jgi:hypothetical protein
MEQMMTTLSFLSRITSSSYSFQPRRLSSIGISLMREYSRPRLAIVSYSSKVYAKPPPVPPSVYAGRMQQGRPIS